MEHLIPQEIASSVSESITPKWLLQMAELMGFLLGGVIAGLIGMRRYHKHQENKASNLFLEVSENQQRIQEALIYLRIKSYASRVRMCEFHNGSKFLSGESVKKFSATRESVKSGVSSESYKIKDFLVSNFTEKIEMLKGDRPSIHSVADLPNCDTKYFFRSINVKKFSLLPISKNKKNIIGFIEVEWDSEQIPIEETLFFSLFYNIRSQIEFLKSKKKKETK